MLVPTLFAIFSTCHCYVVMQVRKGDNKSNVDAFIHKEISTDKLNDLSIMGTESRKQWPNYKRFEIRKRADDDEERFDSPATDPIKDLQSFILSINTGAKPDEPRNEGQPDVIDKIEQMIADIVKVPNNPIYRAQTEYNIKPEIVRLRSEQPVLKLNINSESILRALKDLLSSPAIRKYMDVATKQAAVVYRAIRDDISRRNFEDATPE